MVVLWFPSGLAGPKSPEKENAATPKFSVRAQIYGVWK